MSAENITNQTYDQIASTYADRYWQSSLGDTLRGFAHAIRPNGLVVDMGCGPGRDVLLFQEKGLNAFGFDRSTGMLREAQRRAGGLFACTDMRQVPLAANSVDGIWMCASLLHIPRPDVPVVLMEARRILKPNGVIYISVRAGSGEEWLESDGGPRYFTLFKMDELLEALRQAGFVVERSSADVFGHSTWLSVVGSVEALG